MFALKLVLVPTFLLLVTLAARRWGAAVAGRLAGLPVVTGPVLFFVAIEQGTSFAASAATSAMTAVGAAAAFSLTYAHVCRRWHWLPSIVASHLAWLVMAFVASRLPHPVVIAVAWAVSGLTLALWLLPAVAGPAGPAPSLRRGELAVRMFAGAALTIVLSRAAAAIGPAWTGLFAVFPVMGTVLAVFSHRAHGADYVVPLLRGMILGMYAATAFCLVIATMSVRLGVGGVFAGAVATAFGVQFALWTVLDLRARRAVRTAPAA